MRRVATAALAAGFVACTVVPASAGTTALLGATSTTITTATAPAIAADRFDRAVRGSWGTAAVGGKWRVLSGAGYAVADGGGKQVVGNGKTAAAFLTAVASKDADVTVDVAFNRAAGKGAGVYSSIIARDIPGSGDYRARLVVTPSGGVQLRLAKGATTLRSTTTTGVTYAPGTKMTVRTQAVGTSPTTLRAKVWRAGTAEPSAWQLAATDSTANLQTTGRVNLSTFATGNATPVTATYSALRATPTAVPPATAPAVVQPSTPPVSEPEPTVNLTVPIWTNVDPSAAFTAAAKDLTVSLDGSTSADTDGSLVSYAWTHGDGATSTGAKVTHSYAAPGTYNTTLTVTDDLGASATISKSVSVTAPVPSRNAYLHPFAPSSPWNTAIGSKAGFESATGTLTASLFTAKPVINRADWSVATQHATTSDPLATLTAVRNKTTHQIRIPRDTVATGGLDRHVTVVQPDGVTAYDLYKVTKQSDTQWTAEYVIVVDLRESGILKGVRASGAPGFAGLIRKHEVATKEIPHALAIAVPGSVLKSGYVWPANRQDGDAATSYTGQVPMGTLFAIPPSVDVESMALSAEGKALARALQNYGAYVVDRSGTASLYCELSCDATATERMKTDFRALFPHLRAVTNSTATSVGGGGTPRVSGPAAF